MVLSLVPPLPVVFLFSLDAVSRSKIKFLKIPSLNIIFLRHGIPSQSKGMLPHMFSNNGLSVMVILLSRTFLLILPDKGEIPF